MHSICKRHFSLSSSINVFGLCVLLMTNMKLSNILGSHRDISKESLFKIKKNMLLIISKALSSNYKSAPAHKVLADRIAERDPGNKPTSGDRIQFLYFINSNPISKSKKKVLQADIIETPSFIKDNNLQVDYQYYLEKQIVKPISQLFALIIEDIYKVQGKQQKLKEMRDKIKIVQEQNVGNIEKIRKGLDKIKMAYATELLFGKNLKKNKSKQIDNN